MRKNAKLFIKFILYLFIKKQKLDFVSIRKNISDDLGTKKLGPCDLLQPLTFLLINISKKNIKRIFQEYLQIKMEWSIFWA